MNVKITKIIEARLFRIFLFVGLFIAALVPRCVLALQLDMVTDEAVYIGGGKVYASLIERFPWSIGSSEWTVNYEHPPLAKLLISLTLTLNTLVGQPFNELFAARLPSILLGSLLVLSIYYLGRKPFGQIVALLAALCLAFSPWLAYFGALAYLDMTMTAFITLAFLLLWHALTKPYLYPLIAICVGFAAASKYTAALVVPGMVIFTVYYFFFVRPRLTPEERPDIPWRWWGISILIAPLAFLLVDPAIWPNPIGLLRKSFDFSIRHSAQGHLTFIAGSYGPHVPRWTIAYIIFAKVSSFVTLPAIFFVILAIISLIRFHLHHSAISTTTATRNAFLLIWVISIFALFSLLNIVVGTHYHLPLAAPVVCAGVSGMAIILQWIAHKVADRYEHTNNQATNTKIIHVLVIIVLTVCVIAPHFLALTTIRAAEGYTSEFFPGENDTLQVAYPGYKDALQWLSQHTSTPAKVGLVTLTEGSITVSYAGTTWFAYNSEFKRQFQMKEAPSNKPTDEYDYLIWPMHVVQRGSPPPEPWRSHIIHTVQGGNTIYCYVLARR